MGVAKKCRSGLSRRCERKVLKLGERLPEEVS